MQKKMHMWNRGGNMQRVKLPIGMFSAGSIIQIEFPFDDDTSKSKRRPAIVVDFDNRNTRVIVLKVTTTGMRTQYDYELVDYAMAKLKKGSVVRCNHVLSLRNDFKCEKYSQLSRRDLIAVSILYNKAINDYTIVKS